MKQILEHYAKSSYKTSFMHYLRAQMHGIKAFLQYTWVYKRDN